MEQQYDRFKDAPWFPREDTPCLIGGSGGIGSWLTFFLAKAGFSPILFDHDVIEEHNLGGQLFRTSDIGRPKVAAMADIITTFCGTDINTFQEKVTEDSMTTRFCFSAFDNMKARKAMFQVWKKSVQQGALAPLLIDGRLTMEQLQIFCVMPHTMANYEANELFDDSEVEDLPCTMKQTSHVAAMIASHMTAIFTNHITNLYSGESVRDVPYYYEFFVPINLTNVS